MNLVFPKSGYSINRLISIGVKPQAIARFISSIVIILFVCGCGNPENNGNKQTQKPPTLVVGYQNSPVAALLMVGKDRGFFDSAGINVDMKSFTTGKVALQALSSGNSLDLALSGDLPIVLGSFQGYDLKVITQVVEHTVNECRIVAWKHGDWSTPEKFFSTHRIVATSLNGTPEYFLNVFLKHHNIKRENCEIIGMLPENMTTALLGHSVDAICIFDPVASIVTEKLKDSSVVFQDTSIYSALYVLSTLQKTIDTRKEDLVKFMKGLEHAALYCQEHPDSAKKIIAERTVLDMHTIDTLWHNYNFDIGLTKRLVEYFNAEAKWYLSKEGNPDFSKIPDYKTAVINTSILEQVNRAKIKL